MSLTESAPDRPRRPILRYALIAAAVAVIPASWLIIDNSGRQNYQKAKADWDASALPVKFSRNLPVPPTISPASNLLETGIFKQMGTSAGSMPHKLMEWSAWYGAKPAADWTFDWEAPFRGPSGKRAALTVAPGESRETALIAAIRADFPEFTDLTALRAARPDMGLNYRPPPPGGFTHLRIYNENTQAVFRLLTAYGIVTARQGLTHETATALEIELTYLRMVANTPGNPRALRLPLLAKTHPLPLLHTALESSLDAPHIDHLTRRLTDLPPILSTQRRHSCTEVMQVTEYMDSMEWHVEWRVPRSWSEWMRDWDNFLLLAGYKASPTGYFQDALARHLQLEQNYLTRVCQGGRLNLSAISDFERDCAAVPWGAQRLWTVGSPSYRNDLLSAAATDTALHCGRLALALERHRRRHGSFPEKLSELDPALLSAGGIPVGPLWGLPPEYTRDASGGYTLSYKKEDAADCAPGTEATTARDVTWHMPAPSKPERN